MDQNRHSANKKKAKRAEMNGKVSHMPYKYEKLSAVSFKLMWRPL